VASRAEEVTAAMREKIRSGEMPPDTKLPTIDDLAAEHGFDRNTARRVMNTLKAEGLVEYRPGRGGSTGRSGGTYVRRRPATRVVRSRSIERDNLGYYSGPTVKHWRTIQGLGLAIDTKPVPPDIAELLGIEPGTPVLVRERANGDPEQPKYRQLTTSWFHPSIVEDVPILTGSTGLGGSYDRIEEWAQQPLNWEEEVTAATPSPDEAEALLLPPGVPMLRILRIASLGRGRKQRIVEAQDIRMSGELFSVRYPLQRRGAARWPVEPASDDYYNS
jgi:GntR family transcriptional regulator